MEKKCPYHDPHCNDHGYKETYAPFGFMVVQPVNPHKKGYHQYR